MSFWTELRRRNVVRVGIAYAVGAWLLLQLTEVLSELLDLPPEIGPVVVAIVIIGLPIVLFAAWVYELTPEGIKREKEVQRTESITPSTGRKLDRAIIVLLAIAVAYFATDKFLFRGGEDAPPVAEADALASTEPPTIAVLPLADMSPGNDNEYFSDGLTEELLNILAKISELRVAGRSSSFAFKGQNQDLREIGQKLNVAHILEGSVRKDDANNRVRITLQLIDAESGFHLWSETYDRDLKDIFEIQEAVAHEVAAALRVTLLGEDEERLQQVASTDAGTYDLYLQARKQLSLGGFVNLGRAEDLFQQVLAADPAFSPAKIGLVETWGNMAATGAISTQEALNRGLPVLEAILAQDPKNTEAYRLRGYYYHGAQDKARSDANFERALALDPDNARAYQQWGASLYRFREIERGVALMDRAVELEPYDPEVLWSTCKTGGELGDFDKALWACRRIQELSPDGPKGYYGEAVAYIHQGKLPEVLKGYAEASQRDPEDFEMLAAMAMFWIALGDIDQARAWLARAEAIGAGQPVPVYTRVLLYEALEQYDQAGDLAVNARARQMEDRHGTESFFRRAVVAHAMREGRWDDGLALYRSDLPWVFEEALAFPDTAVDWIDDLIVIAALMKNNDPLSTRPAELLDYAAAKVDDYPPEAGVMTPHLRWAGIHAVRGEEGPAVDALQRFRDFGLFPYWRQAVIENPAVMSLHQNPDYQALLDDYRSFAEEERLRARDLLGVDS